MKYKKIIQASKGWVAVMLTDGSQCEHEVILWAVVEDSRREQKVCGLGSQMEILNDFATFQGFESREV